MLVAITRPASEAQHWADALQAAGHEPVVFPMIDIRPFADVSNLHRAWRQLGDCAAAMFVSGNAVNFFMKARPAASGCSTAEPIQTRAWATGPGTRQALLTHGWPPDLIDSPSEGAAQFDSEALWAVVKPQIRPGKRVLLVRGETLALDAHPHFATPAGVSQPRNGPCLAQVPAQTPEGGRDWLAQRITEAGALAVSCVSYLRCMPELNPVQMRAIRHAVEAHAVWLFSSSEALNNLTVVMPGESWISARAVATHPRIAQRVRSAGFGIVRVARPTLKDVLASIESLP